MKAGLDHVTSREMEVLNLICEGHSTKAVAYHLGITFKTAACHRYRLMDKAGVGNVIELFRWALAEGYITPGGGSHQTARFFQDIDPMLEGLMARHERCKREVRLVIDDAKTIASQTREVNSACRSLLRVPSQKDPS